MARMHVPAACLTILFVVTCVPAVLTAQTRAAHADSADALRARALQLVYEHEHDQGIELLRKAVAIAPDDPATHRTLALAIWLKLLFMRGAVTVDHYLGSFTRPRVDVRKPPPELAAEFTTAVQRAIDLAEKRSATRPRDAQARYDLGAAVGLQATYIASIDGKLLAGFRSARRAYSEHERVLELDPARKDAGVTVGTYRYIVSTLSMPMRMMAYVVGFGGGKERGITMLEETAAAGGEAGTDALFALVLLYNRERRYDDALKALEELRKLYPRNRLVVLEAGSTALRAGRFDQADKMLTEGLAMLAKATGPRIPAEEALWRYKRGAARVELGRAEADADLRAAIVADAQPWIQGRARVERARLAARRGDRAEAAREATQAQTLCEQDNDPSCAEAARKLLRSVDGR
jgi:tetratricopeptide (TPR) repeat protein